MKRTFLIFCLLLAASNSGSCDTEKPNARENPDPETSVQPSPAPSPEYSASQPAAEHQERAR